MNISFKTILKKNIPLGLAQPRRAQIYVGFQCHQGCGFCYYKHSCADKMFNIDKVKQQIDFEYSYGIRDFEITGGEPSEFIQLKDICEYIKNKDANSKIAVITNGGLFASDVWHLIDEVLVSYHISKSPKEYDKSIFPKGSTWNKVAKTIDKAKENNVLVRTNTVLGTFNIDMLPDIVDDLVAFAPKIVNFLPVNVFDQATDMCNYIDYNKLRPMLKYAIDTLQQKIDGIYVYIRYMPLCEMEGYEKHILGQIQHIYDWFDWNRELDGVEVLKQIKDADLTLKKLGSYGSTSLNAALQIRNSFYVKTNKCMTCKYCLICDGIEKTSNNQLLQYIKPSVGKMIKDPLHYFKTNIDLYQSVYEEKGKHNDYNKQQI